MAKFNHSTYRILHCNVCGKSVTKHKTRTCWFSSERCCRWGSLEVFQKLYLLKQGEKSEKTRLNDTALRSSMRTLFTSLRKSGVGRVQWKRGSGGGENASGLVMAHIFCFGCANTTVSVTCSSWTVFLHFKYSFSFENTNMVCHVLELVYYEWSVRNSIRILLLLMPSYNRYTLTTDMKKLLYRRSS